MLEQFEEKKIVYKPLEDTFLINTHFSKKKKQALHKKVHKTTNIILATIIGSMAFADILFDIDVVEYLIDYFGFFLGFSSILILNHFKSLVISPSVDLATPINNNQKLKDYYHKNNNLIQALIFTLLFLLFVTMPSLLTVA